jgi:glycosyltransferase involved in cell wall biosynthesis
MRATDLASAEPLMKVMAVSFSYPPQSEPRAIQVSRLLRHLNVEYVVICHGKAAADSFDTETSRIIRVPLPNSTWRDLSIRAVDRFNVPVFYRTPDHLRAWMHPVLNRVEELIRNESYRPDVVATFSFPLIDAIIGLELKRQYGFPWLAHFSDPWLDNPFKTFDPFTRNLNARLERSVLRNADRIVFTSAETAELVMKKYEPELCTKVRTVPHAFESDLFHKSTQTNGRLVIRFLGDLYHNRTPKPLFMALERLLLSEPGLVNKFVFEVIGDVHELDLAALGLRRLPEGLVLFKPRVTYSESLELMSSASGLMVIDAPVPENCKSVFLPSKLIEYVGAGRPVIGLTPQGTAADLIRDLGGWVADPANPDKLESGMKDFLNFILSQHIGSSAWGCSAVRERFEVHNVADSFERVLNELSSAH